MADQDLDRWTLDRIRTTLDRSESITVEDARWLIDRVAATPEQGSRSMNVSGLNVGQFMDKLRQMDPDEDVKYDFVHFGPTTLESYRGYYEDAALGYEECGRMHRNAQYEYPKVKDLLKHFEDTLGHVFEGWKGGNGRPIGLDTDLWVANPGESGDTIIVDVQKLLFVTIITRQENEQS